MKSWWKRWWGLFAGLGVLACVVGLCMLIATSDREHRRVRSEARTERCTRLCEPRSGMSHWSTIKVGFGSFQVLCVCWDGTEIRLP